MMVFHKVTNFPRIIAIFIAGESEVEDEDEEDGGGGDEADNEK